VDTFDMDTCLSEGHMG